MKSILIYIFLFIPLFCQKVEINTIDIASKKNGVSIKIRSNININPSQLTGWFNESNSWFYMTIHQGYGNIAYLESIKLDYPIKEIEILNIGESLQIGFKMNIPVENFEFYHTDTPPELLAALRFPLADIIAYIQPETQEIKNNLIIKTKNKPIWIKASYFIGIGLATSGLIANKNQKSWEVPIGLSITALAYIYENFISVEKI